MKTAIDERRVFRWGLLIATALGALLRFHDLDGVPIAAYCDETFVAYEAYSLLETGRDSHGRPWPLFFDVFGEGWAEPLYVYLTIPAVAVMGLTPAAARFVAAAAGTAGIPLVGLMTAALFRSAVGSPGTPQAVSGAVRAGLAAAAVMALSPWAFHFSRIAFSASLLPPLLALGFWLAATGMERDEARGARRALAAAITLGAALYTYSAARAAVPVLLAGFAWIYRTELRERPRAFALAAVALVAMSLPIVAFSVSEHGQQRFRNVSILTRADRPVGDRVATVARNYLSYYSPEFLLTEGDPNPRHSVRSHGMLHVHDVVLLLLGLVGCRAANTRGCRFLLWWMATFPLAAALTIDSRHAIRSIAGEPAVYALAGIGFALLTAVFGQLGLGAPIRRSARIAAVFAVLLCPPATFATTSPSMRRNRRPRGNSGFVRPTRFSNVARRIRIAFTSKRWSRSRRVSGSFTRRFRQRSIKHTGSRGPDTSSIFPGDPSHRLRARSSFCARMSSCPRASGTGR